MNAVFFRDILFPVLRAGLDLTDAVPEIPNDAFELLLKTAAQQELLPIAYRAFSHCAPDHPLVARLRDACEDGALRYLMMEQAYAELCAIFDSAALQYLPLKGAVIRKLYPEPWLRTSSDIDVLIPEAALEQSVELLKREAGYTAGERTCHDYSLMGQKAHVELHYRLHDGEGTAQDALLDAVWDYARPTEGSRWEMKPAYLIFYCLAHMGRHLRTQGIGIRPLTDLFLLRRSAGASEDDVRSLCEAGGLLRFYETASSLSEVWYGGATHTPLTLALEQMALGGGVFGNHETAVYAQQRILGRGAEYYWRRLFLPKEEMRRRYPVLSERPSLFPVYYLKRLSRALGKNRKIRYEVELTKTASKQSEDFASLLAQLGL